MTPNSEPINSDIAKIRLVSLAALLLAGCSSEITPQATGGYTSGSTDGTSMGTGGAAGGVLTGGVVTGGTVTGGVVTGGTVTGGVVTGGTVTGGTVTGGTVTGGTTGGGDNLYPPAPMSLDGDPIYTRFMRLTNAQWERAVQDILQLPAPPDKARFFQEAVIGATDFVNNEAVLAVTNDLWVQYHTGTKELVQEITVDDVAIQRIYQGTDARAFIELFGRRAYRRPLTTAEVDRLQQIFDVGVTLSGTASAFTVGAGLVIEAMLQSPHFLYRTELGADGAPLSGYEMASKLSFLLRGTTPSDALLDAAGRGELDSVDGAVALATQMLEEPAAAEMFREFHYELFEFKRFVDVQKDLPEYNPAINAELEESSVMFFDHIYSQNLGVSAFLTSTQGFVGPLLAELYGVPAPGGMTLVDLGPERAGYFSQVPFLLLFGDNEHSSAIHRGVHLNNDVLCATVPPPPGAVSLPPAASGATDRERVETGTYPCGVGCHDAYINPLGFAFENFDGMGRYRTEDNGQPVNSASSYPFVDGSRNFANAAELMGVMATTQMAHACYAKHVAGYALQRDMAPNDATLINDLTTASLGQGASVKQLMLSLIAQPAFATRNGGAL